MTNRVRIFGLSDYWVADALAEAGCRCQDVTHVDRHRTCISTMPAASPAARADGEPGLNAAAFPTATIYVQRREWEDALANNSVMTRTYLRENLEPFAIRFGWLTHRCRSRPATIRAGMSRR